MVKRYNLGQKAIIAFVCVWSLFPIYWALNTSLMSNANAQSRPAQFFPFPVYLSNYKSLFSASDLWPDFSRALLNTVIECVAATIVTIIVAVLASYAFARLQFRFKSTIFYVVLATLSLPIYATLIPLYQIMNQFHLVNTYTGVVLVYTSGFLPLSMWIMYNYFITIPRELEEAAFVDGATPVAVLLRIMMPLALPGITSAAIITFLLAWAQFIFPLVLTSDNSTQPLTVFMTGLLGRHTVPFTLMNATGILSIVVPAAIVILLNRYIISGILAGSIK
jgi:multiple sugar transport system permease protein